MSSPSSLGCPDSDSTNFWVKDGLRKQIEAELHSKVRSLTDHALLEEVLRYGNVFDPKGILDSGLSSSFSFFPGRTPEGEYYDYSGAVCETAQGEIPVRMINAPGFIEGETVTRWELMEVSNGYIEEIRVELSSVRTKPQEARGWEEVSWEESDLARFSKFLGFLTEGLEKDILAFLVKIRKRWERIHSKTLLEKSKFERELKRLECSINYERGKKQKFGLQGRGCQIMEVQ